MTTKPKDIGHVAPSYGEFDTYNTLVIRPEYRISLRLGDIEELFTHPPDTDKGRMERLQVLGLFYYPLKHDKAATAYSGVAAGVGPPAPNSPPPAPAVPGAWSHHKEKSCGHVTVEVGPWKCPAATLPNTQVSKTSSAKVFNLTNMAQHKVSITNFTTGGVHKDQFSVKVKSDTGADIDSSNKFEIAAGKSFSTVVEFQPTGSSGPRMGNITFDTSHEAGGGCSFTLNMTATASSGPAPAQDPGAPVLVDIGKPSEPAVKMPTTQVNKTSAPKVITLTNRGTTEVKIKDLTLPNPNTGFNVTVKNDEGAKVSGDEFTIAKDKSYAAEVEFKPKTDGNATANLTFEANYSGNVKRSFTLAMNGAAQTGAVADGVDNKIGDDEIKKRLKEWVVFRLDGTAEGGQGGVLPVEAPVDGAGKPKPDEKKGHFAKIRIPGGFSLLKSWQATALDLNNDTSGSADYAGWTLGKDLYEVETQFREDNPVIGKIPLIAKVEKKEQGQDNWKPIKDAWVYFQLVKPYDLPAFEGARPVTKQLNRPDLRKTTVGPPAAGPAPVCGPAKYADIEEKPTGVRAPDPADPQGGNCPQDRGGNQGKGSLNDGSDVANVVFSTTSMPGFNEAYKVEGGNPTRPAKRTHFFPTATGVSSSDHGLHAVKAKTNDEGEAGVIFTPSRCGGDRYRIRAYVGHDTITGPGKDGSGDHAVRVDTGTFVVWRNIRISRYVRQPVNPPAAPLLAEVNNATYNITTNNRYLQCTNARWNSNAAYTGVPTADFNTKVDAGAVYDSIPVQWARAFVEVDIDKGIKLPEEMSQADWQAAREQAWRDAELGMTTLAMDLNLHEFLHMGTAAINVKNSVVHIPMRTWQAYNALFPGPDPKRINMGAVSGNNRDNIVRLFREYMVPGFFRSLSRNGYTPGYTIIQGGFGCTWQLLQNLIPNNSGWSLEYRGGAVWGGSDWYPTAINAPPPAGPPWGAYNFTCNSAHELGHVIYRLHAPGNDPGGSPGGGFDPDVHDDIAKSLCVMSYRTCEGQFCARCLFAFRGWNIKAMP